MVHFNSRYRTTQASGIRRSAGASVVDSGLRVFITAYHRDGNDGCMRKDELDLIEALATPKVLDNRSPAVATVAQAMGPNDGRSVSPSGGKDQRSGASDRRGHDE